MYWHTDTARSSFFKFQHFRNHKATVSRETSVQAHYSNKNIITVVIREQALAQVMILRFPAIGWHLDLLLRNRVAGRVVIHKSILVVSYLTLPSVICKVLKEILIFDRKVYAGHIRNEEVGDQDAGHTANGGNYERPSSKYSTVRVR